LCKFCSVYDFGLGFETVQQKLVLEEEDLQAFGADRV